MHLHKIKNQASVAASSSTRLASSDVKGTMKVLKKKYRNLSPAIGCALSHSSFLLNMYRYGAAASLTVQLVRELFYKAGQSEHLHPTHNKSKPAYFLNPDRLGALVALIEGGKLRDEKLVRDLLEPWYRESRCSRSSLTRFIKLVTDSLQECSANSAMTIYFPHTVTHILLAFLWQSVTSREQLVVYLLSVDRNLAVKGSIFKNKFAVSEKTRALWLKKAFDRFEVRDEDLSSDALKTAKLYEEMTATSLLLRNKQLPSLLGYHWYGFKEQTTRPDCVESCIRNLINILLFDIEKQELDISRLEVLRPYPPLLHYYKGEGAFRLIGPQTSDHFVIMSALSGQAWMELLSNLRGIRYLSGAPEARYEIQPDMHNVLAVLNVLFNVRASSLPELGKMISRKDCIINLKMGQVSERGSIKCGEVHISYELRGIKIDGIKLVVEPNHAWMKIPSLGQSIGSDDDLIEAWLKWIKRPKHSHVLPLLALLMEPKKGLHEFLFDINFVETRQIYQLLMSLHVSDPMLDCFDEGPTQHWLIKDFAKNYRSAKM